jgi:hypothetical protein
VPFWSEYNGAYLSWIGSSFSACKLAGETGVAEDLAVTQLDDSDSNNAENVC